MIFFYVTIWNFTFLFNFFCEIFWCHNCWIVQEIFSFIANFQTLWNIDCNELCHYFVHDYWTFKIPIITDFHGKLHPNSCVIFSEKHLSRRICLVEWQGDFFLSMFLYSVHDNLLVNVLEIERPICNQFGKLHYYIIIRVFNQKHTLSRHCSSKIALVYQYL